MKCHPLLSVALAFSAPIAAVADYTQPQEGHDGKVTQYVTRYTTICPIPSTCDYVAPTALPVPSGSGQSESGYPTETHPQSPPPTDSEKPTETHPQGPPPTDSEKPTETHPTGSPPEETGKPTESHPTKTPPPYPTGSLSSSHHGPTGSGYTSSGISSNLTSSYYPTGTGYSHSVGPTNSANNTKSETYPTSSATNSTTSSEVYSTSSETKSSTFETHPTSSATSSETSSYSSTPSSETSSATTSETSSYSFSATSSITSSETSSYTSSATSSATTSETTSYTSSTTSSATTSETSSYTSSTTSSSPTATPTDCVYKAVPAPNPPSGSTCEKTGGTETPSMGEDYTEDAAACAVVCHNTPGCASTSYDVSNPDTHLCKLYGSSAGGGINPYGGFTFYDQGCWTVAEVCGSPAKRALG